MSKKKEETMPVPVNIDDQIKKQLQEQRGQLGALPANKIQLRDKEFTLPDGQKSNGPLECIVLDFVWNMVHYPGMYNANNPQQPDCFAVGRNNPEDKTDPLVPHEDVEKPLGPNCRDCNMNQWKSAPSGSGKACKNQRRLLIVPPDFDADTEAMAMYVSPKGLKGWDKYVSRLNNEHGLLPAQVITAISFDANETYPLLKFALVERHTRVQEAWELRERFQEFLFRPVETKTQEAAY